MKKILSTVFVMFLIFSSYALYGQKNKKKKNVESPLTAEQVLQSNDPTKIAAFIRANPNDENIPMLKSKIIQLLSPSSSRDKVSYSSTKEYAKTQATPASADKSNKLQSLHSSNDETAKILSHLFSNDTSSREAFVQITNTSDCPIEVLFLGKNRQYSLSIPAKKQNHIMLLKGQYTLSSKICDAKYSSLHLIDKDYMIKLGK